MTKNTIMIVEDEPALRENYAAALSRQGYDVITFADRTAATQSFQQRLPDLAILDIGLGNDAEAGFELCRDLRARCSRLPIIFLTARDSDVDTISGLRLGADDYLTKNISLQQLSARVSALFRRVAVMSQAVADNAVIQQGELSMDTDCMVVQWRGQVVELTLTEFWMVHSLARIPGHVKTREQLMRDAKIFVDDETVTSHIKRIRKKFKVTDSDFDAIETLYGMGYRWNK